VVDVEHRDARPADVEAGVDVVTLVDAEFVNPEAGLGGRMG
jgi:hypothetical protein